MGTGRAIGRAGRLAAPALKFFARSPYETKRTATWILMLAPVILAVACNGGDTSDRTSLASVPESPVVYSALTARAGDAPARMAFLENAAGAGAPSVSGSTQKRLA